MSVVNKMLQDLEKRQNDEGGVSTDYQPPQQSKRSFNISILFTVLAVVVVALWWFKDTLWGAEQLVTPLLLDASMSQPATAQTPEQNPPSEQPSTQSIPVRQLQPSDPQVQSQPAVSGTKVLSATNAQESDEQHIGAQRSAPPSISVTRQDTASEPSQHDEPSPQNNQPTQLSANPANTVPDDLVPITAAKAKSVHSQATDKNATQTVEPIFNIRSNIQDTSLASLKQQAQAAIQQGDDRQAILTLHKILAKEPHNRAVRKTLAALMFAQDQKFKAQQVLTEGLARDPDAADIRLMLARLYVQMRDNQQAYQVLTAYPVNAAINPDYVSFRASLAQQLLKFGAAKDDYAQLLQSQPSNGKWWLGLGICEEKLDRHVEALGAYQEALSDEQLGMEVRTFVQQRIRYLKGVK